MILDLIEFYESQYSVYQPNLRIKPLKGVWRHIKYIENRIRVKDIKKKILNDKSMNSYLNIKTEMFGHIWILIFIKVHNT